MHARTFEYDNSLRTRDGTQPVRDDETRSITPTQDAVNRIIHAVFACRVERACRLIQRKNGWPL